MSGRKNPITKLWNFRQRAEEWCNKAKPGTAGEQQNCHELFRNKAKLAPPLLLPCFWPAGSRRGVVCDRVYSSGYELSCSEIKSHCI